MPFSVLTSGFIYLFFALTLIQYLSEIFSLFVLTSTPSCQSLKHSDILYSLQFFILLITSSSDNNSTISFDLTMQTKKWQNRNNNYGIVLAPYSAEECTAFVRFASMSYSSNKPVVEVSYRYNTGIEDCYTYQTMNVGSAGTVYLSDFSLQSTVIRTLANNGIVSFDMVYNSVFSDGGCDSLQFANGWMFNSNESATLGNPYILWKDEDGTIHYYDYASGSGFIDEENSENTIFAIGLNVVSDDLEKFCAADSYYAQFTQDCLA